MTSQQQQAKQPVNKVLAGPYGHPYHPILVTVPIGAWVSSLVFDLGSRLSDDGRALAIGSVWLIAIGVIGALVAAAVGLLDLLAIPRGTAAFGTALLHMSLNLTITVGYVVNFFWRRASYGDVDAVGIGPIVLSVLALAALGVSGYLGGKLAYHYGVRVADEGKQAEGYDVRR